MMTLQILNGGEPNFQTITPIRPFKIRSSNISRTTQFGGILRSEKARDGIYCINQSLSKYSYNLEVRSK
jgi:hypothetical protein